jgi:beta-fructofuranosidase
MNRRDLLRLCGALAAPVARDTIARDPHRPQYHLVAPAHRINDPNGPIYHRGTYHMFYQKACPDGKHWGHAASPDMLHWKHLPDAIAPTPGGPDRISCASGGCVIHNGTPTIIYTGFRPEVQCIATSNDDMVTWHKYPGNPVVTPPKGMAVIPKSSSAAPEDFPEGATGITGFRDPRVWAENDVWYMIVGSGFPGRGGAALMFRSRDLRRWEYLHPLCIGFRDPVAWGPRPHNTGEVWECPDFFPLGDKHVLIVSSMLRTLYFTGRYEGLHFYPEVEGCCDFGPYYAAQSQLNARGERILWGWVRETRSTTAQARAGWGSAISLPRVLSLESNGTLRYALPKEVESLRGEHFTGLEKVRGDCLEIIAEINPAGAAECGLVVRCSTGAEQTRIIYRPADRVLAIDLSRSTLAQDPGRPSVPSDADPWLHAPLELGRGETLQLRVLLDGSVMEVFANDRTCVSARIYPSRPDSLGAEFLSGGQARLARVDAWRMQPISPNRLTR